MPTSSVAKQQIQDSVGIVVTVLCSTFILSAQATSNPGRSCRLGQHHCTASAAASIHSCTHQQLLQLRRFARHSCRQAQLLLLLMMANCRSCANCNQLIAGHKQLMLLLSNHNLASRSCSTRSDSEGS